jgi:hypothetical protein
MFGGPAIDAGRMRIQMLEDGRGDTGLRGLTTTLAFHRRLLYTAHEPPGTGMRMSGNLLNGITPQ